MPAISPWLIAAAVASAAASVGGTAASMVGQAAVEKKQNAARNAERARQQAIDKERQAALDAAVPKYDRPNQDEQRGDMAEQIQQYIAPSAPVDEYVAQNPGAPKEVTDSLSRQLAGALSTGKDYAKNLASVSAYSRMGLNNKLSLNRLGENVNMLNNMSGRSTGVLGTELDGAYGAGSGANSMAAILNGVAGLANAGVGYGLMTSGGTPAAANNTVYIQKPS